MLSLERSFTRISKELRAQYLVTYNPTNKSYDGTFRKIDVKLGGRTRRSESENQAWLQSNRRQRNAIRSLEVKMHYREVSRPVVLFVLVFLLLCGGIATQHVVSKEREQPARRDCLCITVTDAAKPRRDAAGL